MTENAPHATKRLQAAFELSRGKPWGAMWATNISFEKINEYSSYLLHIAQLLTADQIHKRYPDKALNLTIEAVRHARRGKPILLLLLYMRLDITNKNEEI